MREARDRKCFFKVLRAYTVYKEYRKYAMHVAVKNLCRCATHFLLFLSFSLSPLPLPLPTCVFSFPMSAYTFAYAPYSLYYLCTRLIKAVTSHVTLILYQFPELHKYVPRNRNIFICGRIWQTLNFFDRLTDSLSTQI